MHILRFITAMVLATGLISATLAQAQTQAPASTPDNKIDIRKIPCVELVRVDDDDRVAMIFFYYGFYASTLNVFEVSPANLERNVRNVVEFCRQNPDTPIFDVLPKAFQR